jgi:O-antigen biosynthesis protein
VPDKPPWARYLDPSCQPADHYHDYVHAPLFPLIEGTPSRVLDLGCASGALGAALKQRFPGAHVTGIEAGDAAARVAATRIDRVVHASLDGIDFAAHGIAPASIDVAIASDVLEHLVNPWDLLVRLRPFLAPGGQVVASIPNARNITVAATLLGEGEFRYDERGLMDVTHLRFFTLRSMARMFEETGYRFEKHEALLLPTLQAIYEQYRGRGATQVKVGRILLEKVSEQDLIELCTAQFLVRARPDGRQA